MDNDELLVLLSDIEEFNQPELVDELRAYIPFIKEAVKAAKVNNKLAIDWVNKREELNTLLERAIVPDSRFNNVEPIYQIKKLLGIVQ